MIDPADVFNGIQIASGADGSFRASWHIPVDLPYFSGHFPGAPIFPAVGIVDATVHALRTHLKAPSLQLTGIALAKFLSPVLPDHKIVMEFRPEQNSEWQCEWKDEGEQKVLTNLRLSCRLS